MVRKRSNVCINIDSSQDCDSVESEDIFDSEDNHSCASHGIDVSAAIIIFINVTMYFFCYVIIFFCLQHSHDGDRESIKRAAYKEVLKDVSTFYFFILYFLLFLT